MHVGLILPAYGSDEHLQIPSLSLLAKGLAEKIDVTIIPLRNPSLSGTDGKLRTLDPLGAGLRFRTLVRHTIDLIRNEHRRHPFDVLHAYWLFEPGAVAAFAGQLLRIPVVVSIGGAELSALQKIGYGGARTYRGRMLNRIVMRSADIVTGGSQHVLEQARDLEPTAVSRLRFAPLPVDVSLTRGSEELSHDSNARQLLQIGSYLPVKGQDQSIRAVASLARTYPQLSLTIIGEDPFGYRRRMRDLALSLGVNERIQLLDRVPHWDLIDQYRNSALLLMPSRHESQGMVVLEAAVQGLPTVGTGVGVVRDLAPEAAFAITPGNFQLLASAIYELLDDIEQRRDLARTVRQRVIEEYGVEPVVRRWLKIYGEVARGE